MNKPSYLTSVVPADAVPITNFEVKFFICNDKGVPRATAELLHREAWWLASWPLLVWC